MMSESFPLLPAVRRLGLTYERLAELTIFMLLEFALGPVWVWLFVNESPSRWTLVGGALVICAVLGRSFAEFRSRGSSRSTA